MTLIPRDLLVPSAQASWQSGLVDDHYKFVREHFSLQGKWERRLWGIQLGRWRWRRRRFTSRLAAHTVASRAATLSTTWAQLAFPRSAEQTGDPREWPGPLLSLCWGVHLGGPDGYANSAAAPLFSTPEFRPEPLGIFAFIICNPWSPVFWFPPPSADMMGALSLRAA